MEKQLRMRYFQEFLEALDRKWRLPFQTDDMTLSTDFRDITLGVSLEKRRSVPILLLPGWGSGWEGTLPLAFALACRGYRIILVSLPGYGDSENPLLRYWQENLFRHHAGIVLSILRALDIPRAYFVGHSMGAQILAEAARILPAACEKLVLLHPSGLEKRSFLGRFSLLWKFATSGARLQFEHRRSGETHDEIAETLADFCGKQKSPFKGRLRLRRAEGRTIFRGGLLETLEEFPGKVVLVSGDQDTVFDAEKSRDLLMAHLGSERFSWNIVPGNPHNPTLFHAEQTANAICLMLRD